MSKPSDSSGSNTGLVIVVVLAVLGIPCCGGVLFLLGAGFFFARIDAPAQPAFAPGPAPVQIGEVLEASPDASQVTTPSTTVTVDAEGNMTFGGQAMTWEQLQTALQERRQSDPSLELLLKIRGGEDQATQKLLEFLLEGGYAFAIADE